MDKDLILLGHGSGGKLSHQLLEQVVIPALSDVPLSRHNDAAVIECGGLRLAFSTDSHVVDPIFFHGGNIGSLAVNGTVNDLAMVGAMASHISAGLIIEEGFSRSDLAVILTSMRAAADLAGVTIVTGDTKVLPRGKVDRIFINTSGIGFLNHQFQICGSNAIPGDKVIVSGTIGDHGIAILSAREGLDLETKVKSDTAALNGLVAEMLKAGEHLHAMRDPTRGGVATTIKEIALQSQVTIRLDEAAIPIRNCVKGVCNILGLDPMHVANEGKLLAIVAADGAEDMLKRMRRNPLGADAAIIGEVVEPSFGKVVMETVVGGLRGVDMLAGEQLPRIC